MKLASVSVKLQLPYIGGIEGNWEPDERERDAAWEMYVELITRVAVLELRSTEGLMSEALTSLYALFDITRGILRKYGPQIARSKRGSDLSFGSLAVTVLNGVLRPLLAKWHPLLLDYESQRGSDVSALEHEHAWSHAEQLRAELDRARQALSDYADILAEVAGIKPLRWPQREANTGVRGCQPTA